MQRIFASYTNYHYLCTRNSEVGAIAQLVEQRTENPCVPGSIPGGTTTQKAALYKVAFIIYSL